MGNHKWSIIILGVIFIPMTVGYVGVAIWHHCKENSSRKKKLLILLFPPILAVFLIPIMTVAYIGYVAYVFARKCLQPDYIDDDVALFDTQIDSIQCLNFAQN